MVDIEVAIEQHHLEVGWSRLVWTHGVHHLEVEWSDSAWALGLHRLEVQRSRSTASPVRRLSTSLKRRRRKTLKTVHVFQHLSTKLKEIKGSLLPSTQLRDVERCAQFSTSLATLCWEMLKTASSERGGRPVLFLKWYHVNTAASSEVINLSTSQFANSSHCKLLSPNRRLNLTYARLGAHPHPPITMLTRCKLLDFVTRGLMSSTLQWGEGGPRPIS